MAVMEEALLAKIELKLRQDGAVVVDFENVDAKALVEVLDSGSKGEYENAHTIASTINMARGVYELLNDNIKEHFTN